MTYLSDHVLLHVSKTTRTLGCLVPHQPLQRALPSQRNLQERARRRRVGVLTAAVAVVGRREDGDDLVVVAPVIALHHQLVRPRHQLQAVVVVELLADVLPKGVARTPRRDAPPAAVVRVRPQQVAHGTCTRAQHTAGAKGTASCNLRPHGLHPQTAAHTSTRQTLCLAILPWAVPPHPERVVLTFVGHFLHAVQVPDVVQAVNGGREAPMQAEDLVLDLHATPPAPQQSAHGTRPPRATSLASLLNHVLQTGLPDYVAPLAADPAWAKGKHVMPNGLCKEGRNILPNPTNKADVQRGYGWGKGPHSSATDRGKQRALRTSEAGMTPIDNGGQRARTFAYQGS